MKVFFCDLLFWYVFSIFGLKEIQMLNTVLAQSYYYNILPWKDIQHNWSFCLIYFVYKYILDSHVILYVFWLVWKVEVIFICTESENRRRSQGVACRCLQAIFFKPLGLFKFISDYDPITPQQEGLPLSATRGRAGQLCGIESLWPSMESVIIWNFSAPTWYEISQIGT